MEKQQTEDRNDIDFLLEKSKASDELFKKHSEIICDYITYKKECTDFHRRKGEEQDALVLAYKTLSDAVLVLTEESKKTTETNKKNAESLGLIADVVTTYNTGKKALPIVAVIAGWIVLIVVAIISGWFYLKTSIGFAVDWLTEK